MIEVVYPEAIQRLIEALEWRTERFGKPGTAKSLTWRSEQLPPLLLIESPNIDGWNSQEVFSGYSSMTDFLANASPKLKRFPGKLMCLVTIGDSLRPAFTPFQHQYQAYDVRATAATVLAYYEAKERLPRGFTKEVIDWLTDKTYRIGFGSSDAEAYSDQRAKEAVGLFYDAILSVCEAAQAPLLKEMFRYDTADPNFAYSSRFTEAGRATRIFCRSIGTTSSEYYNEVLAEMFEWQARELLTWHFLRNVGRNYQLDPEKLTYRSLPPPQMVGALTHLPEPAALPQVAETV